MRVCVHAHVCIKQLHGILLVLLKLFNRRLIKLLAYCQASTSGAIWTFTSSVVIPCQCNQRLGIWGNWSSGYLGSSWLKKLSQLSDTGYSHVRTVGMRAANIRNNMEKKRKPELLRTFFASFPIPKYSKPIRSPIPMWDVTRRCVRTC